MGRLPRDVSAEAAIKAFVRLGFVVDHQTGSHVILYHVSDPTRMLSVPHHNRLKTGTLRKLIRLSGLTVDQFSDAL